MIAIFKKYDENIFVYVGSFLNWQYKFHKLRVIPSILYECRSIYVCLKAVSFCKSNTDETDEQIRFASFARDAGFEKFQAVSR